MKYLLSLILAIVVMSATSSKASAAWVVAYDAGYHQWYVVATDANGDEVAPYYWYDSYPYSIGGFYPERYYRGPNYYRRCPHQHHNWHGGSNHGHEGNHGGHDNHGGNHHDNHDNHGGNHGGGHGGHHGGGHGHH